MLVAQRIFGRARVGGSPVRTERKTPAGSRARKLTQGRVLILVFITENGVRSHSLLLCVNLISPTPLRKKSFSNLLIEFLCPPPVGGLVFFQSTNVDENDNVEVPGSGHVICRVPLHFLLSCKRCDSSDTLSDSHLEARHVASPRTEKYYFEGKSTFVSFKNHLSL